MRSRSSSRWLVVLLVLVFALAACAESEDSGDDGDDGSDDRPSELQTGAGIDEGSKTITLGLLTPTTGAFGILGDQVTAGNQLFYEALNEDGGVDGEWTIELVTADTQYSGEVARAEYQRIRDQVAGFAQVLGTEVTQNVLPLLQEDGYSGAPATLDAEWVVEPNLAPVASPYQIEAINGAAHYEETEGFDGKTACTIRQDDTYGEAGEEGADFAATELGFEIATTANFATGDDMTAQIQQLQDANCDVVFQASTLIDSPNIWGRANAVGFTPRWIALGPAWSSSFASGELAQYIQDYVWVVAEDGISLDESIPGVAQMIDDRERLGSDIEFNLFSFFGYLSAWGYTQVLEQALDGNDLTPQGIVQAINEDFTLTFDGAAGDYEYGSDRNPPRVNAIFTGDANTESGLGIVELSVESDAAQEYSF